MMLEVRLYLAVICGLLAQPDGLTAAGLTLWDGGRAAGASYAPASRDTLLWSQPPGLAFWTKRSSQIDLQYPFDSGCADDYVWPSSHWLIEIRWWGGSWATTAPCSPDAFVITFYEADESCMPPQPGGVFPVQFHYQEILSAGYWTETVLDPQNDLREYSADVGPVWQAEGRTYWLDIRAVMASDPCGEWGWLSGTSAWGCAAVGGFPLLQTDYWTAWERPDMAFELYGGFRLPAAHRSWGAVKALYR